MKNTFLSIILIVNTFSLAAAEIDPVMSFGETRTFSTYLTSHPIGYTSYDYSSRDLPSFVSFNEKGVISRSGTWPLYFPRFYAEYDLVIEDGAEVGTYTFYLDYELSLYGSSPIDRTITIHLTIEDSNQDHDFSIASLEILPSPQHAGNECEVSFTHLYGGTAAANQSSYCQFYLSVNTTYEPGTDIELSDGSFFSTVSTRYPSSSEKADVTIPLSTAAGDYYVLVLTDFENIVAETDESNNIASVPISVVEPMYNDLYLDNLAAEPSSIQAGGTTGISFEQRYTGNSVNFLGVNSKIHLSTNTTWGDADDVSLGNDMYARVDVNNTSDPVSTNATIPLNTATGTYYILVMSDYENVHEETDETNNVSSMEISVVNAAVNDFSVENLAADPSSIQAGGTSRITFDQVYSGNSVSAVNPRYAIRLSSNTTWGDADDISLNSNIYSSLSKDDTSDPVSEQVTIPLETDPGDWYILVMADVHENFEESDETNNVASLAITVIESAQNDFSVENLAADPSSIQAGGESSITFDQVYSGNSVSTLNPRYAIRLSSNTIWGDADDVTLRGSIYSYLSKDNSSSSASEQITIPLETLPGDWYILVMADVYESFEESDETNNVASLQITVIDPAQNDFSVENLAADPSSIQAGGKSSITFDRIYTGNSVSTLNPYYAIRLSSNTTWGDADDVTLRGSIYTYLSKDNSSSSASEQITIPLETLPGDWYILVMADVYESFEESDETNNVASLAITVIESAQNDFSVENLAADPLSIQAGGKSSITFDRIYTGNSVSTLNPYYAIRLSSNTTWGDADDVTLRGSIYTYLSKDNASSAASEQITIPLETAPGDWYILVMADVYENFEESDEINNVASLQITVIDPAQNDFSVENLAGDPSSIQAGGTSRITFDRIYTGNSVSTLNPYYAIRLSSNATWGDADDVTLRGSIYTYLSKDNSSSSASEQITIPLETAPGDWYILVMADIYENFEESDETNNVAFMQVTVEEAAFHDFLVENLTADPASIVSGGRTKVTFDQVYGGNSVSTVNPKYKIHLSSNTIWGDADDESLSYDLYSSLSAGNASDPVSRYVTIPESITKGRWYILVMADCYEQFEETDESNNISSFVIQVDCEEIISTELVSICEGDAYMGWTESGSYSRTFVTLEGCDSIITTELTVNPVFSTIEDITICDGGSYQGWTTSGQYSRTLTSAEGCDSIVITNLTTSNTVEHTESIEICEGESYEGWSVSGEYLRTLQSAFGCDSVVTTLLSVHPSYDLTENVSIATGGEYMGWTESGSYIRTLYTAFGCDSSITTNLEVIDATEILKADFIADSWYGEAPFEVFFSNTSNGDFESSEWDLGDGSSSNEKNPVHLYTRPGIYTVSLTIRNQNGTDQLIKTNFIQVYNTHTEDTVSIEIVPGDSSQLIIQHQPPFSPTSIVKETRFGSLNDPVLVKLDSLVNSPESNAFWAYYKLFLKDEAKTGEKYLKQFVLHYFRSQLAVSYTHNYLVIAVENYATQIPLGEEDRSGFDLFPNPAHNRVYIELTNPGPEKAIIMIYNAVGETILSQEANGLEGDLIEINTAGWTRGIYHVGIITGNNRAFKKLILW